MNARRIKGEQLARAVQIQKKGMDKWIVPSQTGNGEYTVNRSVRILDAPALTTRIGGKRASISTPLRSRC